MIWLHVLGWIIFAFGCGYAVFGCISFALFQRESGWLGWKGVALLSVMHLFIGATVMVCGAAIVSA